MTETIIKCFTTFLLVAPIVVKVLRLFAVVTNNKQVHLLAERAHIIVSALEQEFPTNHQGRHKQTLAIDSLRMFADEVGIKLTRTQAVEYIDAAVKELHEHEQVVKAQLDPNEHGLG